MVDYDAETARIWKVLDEVEVESLFNEDEIENVFQFDSEGEEDNVEVNEYYSDSDPDDPDAVLLDSYPKLQKRHPQQAHSPLKLRQKDMNFVPDQRTER